LHLHQSFNRGNFDRTTHQLIQELNLEPYLLKCALSTENAILTNEQLNLLYNACDVGINTCMGEGWGLVNFEHAATKAPQILPAHSCFPEIWKDSALWITSMERKEVNFTPHFMYTIDPKDAANQLEKLYKDSNLQNEYGQKGYDIVTQSKYDWQHIEAQWQQLFQAYAKSQKLKYSAVLV
jgi:glycosyltransferase involved in cell wall biosynthesis